MVTLYVRGQRVSSAEAEKALAEAPAGVNEIELRNDAGRILARVLPESLARADDPDWVKAITAEEIEPTGGALHDARRIQEATGLGMTYSVVWSQRAAPGSRANRAVVGRSECNAPSVDWIDFALRRNPHERGEARSENLRLWYEDELAVYYRIDEAPRRVEILFVGPARRR